VAQAAPPSSSITKAREAPRGSSSFVDVAEAACADLPDVIDAEDATFVVSETWARRAVPGREMEEVAGLPSPRGGSQGFASRPFILAVERPDPGGLKPDTSDLLGYFLFDFRAHAFSRMETGRFEQPGVFGDFPIALPVHDGTLVVTFVHGTKRPTDPGYSVPAGDGSEALLVSKDGRVSRFPSWPNVLFNMPIVSADEVIWAVVIRPGMAGNFVLRVPLAGAPRYFSVPGTQGCRGDERLFYPAALEAEGARAEEVTVELRESSSCLAKGAVGRYRLSAANAQWHRQPAGDEPAAGDAEAAAVNVGGATLRIEGTRALITGPGTEAERDADPDPPGDPAQRRSLVVTAGGREVWLQTRWRSRCRLGRYRSW
jgi:hypothetical protein